MSSPTFEEELEELRKRLRELGTAVRQALPLDRMIAWLSTGLARLGWKAPSLDEVPEQDRQLELIDRLAAQLLGIGAMACLAVAIPVLVYLLVRC